MITKQNIILFIVLGSLIFLMMIGCKFLDENKSKQTTEEPKTEEPKKVYPTMISDSNNRYYSIGYVDHTVSEIHYRLFTTGSGAVTVINVTKDSLEVINLQKK